MDVERLDRETEADDCYNWTIKATIKGEVLRELGVIYNGNFYAISEHPSYTRSDFIQGQPQQPPPIPSTSGTTTTTTSGGGSSSGGVDPPPSSSSASIRRVVDDDEDMRL